MVEQTNYSKVTVEYLGYKSARFIGGVSRKTYTFSFKNPIQQIDERDLQSFLEFGKGSLFRLVEDTKPEENAVVITYLSEENVKSEEVKTEIEVQEEIQLEEQKTTSKRRK